LGFQRGLRRAGHGSGIKLTTMLVKDFKDKKVLIMGLGLHGGGEGSARFMVKAGARVLITDLKPEKELKSALEKLSEFKNIKYVLGQHRSEDFKKADLIIKNPAVPDNSKYLEIARKNKIKIESNIGLFFELCKAPIIGITGSSGKSASAALIYEVLKKKFQSVFWAGNLKTPILDILGEVKAGSLVILELSALQLKMLEPHQKSPHLAILTNVATENYQRVKDIIFKFQDEDDYLLVNKELKDVEAKSQIIFYSGESQDAAQEVGKIFEVDQKDVQKAIGDYVKKP